MRPDKDMGVGMRWFFGKVEDRDDPEKVGRVRVRVFGIHSSDESLVPTDTLPWAAMSMDPTSASSAEVGQSPTGIAVGSMVWGFFLDGDECQQPVVCGTWWGMPGGESDVSKFATGDKQATKGDGPSEPADTAKPQYPYNKVTTTESGHLIEVDDTPGATRIHIHHNSGTYLEMTHQGDGIWKVKKDQYEIVVGNKTMHVGGNVTINVDGNCVTNVKGNMTTKVDGNVQVTASSVEITEG